MVSTLRFARHFAFILLVLLFTEVFSTALVPKPIAAKTDISYGGHERQCMDIYYPREAAKMKEPLRIEMTRRS